MLQKKQEQSDSEMRGSDLSPPATAGMSVREKACKFFTLWPYTVPLFVVYVRTAPHVGCANGGSSCPVP